MGFNWGGKKWRPADMAKKQPKINQSIEELLKPLSEKTWKGNVWGSQIMNVEKETSTPDVSPSPTPTVTPTQSVTPTPTPSISITPTPTITPSPSPVPLSFQQTNDVPSPALTDSANCISRTAGAAVLRTTATVGGTAGSTEFTSSFGNFATNIYFYQCKLEIPPGTNWNAGTWTWRIDMNGSGFVRLRNIDICRVNSSGVSQATIATVSTDQTANSTRQVFSDTVPGIAQTPSSGDYVVITYSFAVTSSGGRTINIYPTQIINSPYT